MTVEDASPIPVQIIAAPVACADGFQDRWREVAAFAASQLVRHYGPAVQVTYFDLFDQDCPPLPSGVELPVVLVAGEVLSSGGKISVPLIRQRVEMLATCDHCLADRWHTTVIYCPDLVQYPDGTSNSPNSGRKNDDDRNAPPRSG